MFYHLSYTLCYCCVKLIMSSIVITKEKEMWLFALLLFVACVLSILVYMLFLLVSLIGYVL